MHRSTNDTRPVVAYGSSQFAATGPGERAVPTDSIYKRCCRFYPTVPVDEFRTTRLCNGCQSPLQNVKIVSEEKKSTEPIPSNPDPTPPAARRSTISRDLKWCTNTQCKFKPVNRDLNAALNIWSVFHHQCNNIPLHINFGRNEVLRPPFPAICLRQ